MFAGDNECLRVDLTRPIPPNPLPTVNFQMFVINPWGTVYQCFARSPTNPRPLVKIVTRGAGWYTVLVQRDFDVTEASDFTVQYGRYNAGNSNCAIPTQPKLSQQAAAMGLTGMQEADAAREARRERRNAIRVTPSAEVPEDSE